MGRKTVALIAVGAALAAAVAVPAFAAVGDVISSFHIPRGLRIAGIYRDADYVYLIMDKVPGKVLRTYTVDGSFVRSMPLEESGNYATEGDHSPKGPGYFALFELPPLPSDFMYVVSYDLATGSVADSVEVPADTIFWEPQGYAYVPGSLYMYYGIWYMEVGPGWVIQCTTTGSITRNIVKLSGDLAATPLYNSFEGEYVILGGSPTQVYKPSGSLVGSFALPGYSGDCICGPGAPSSYKITYWCIRRINYEDYCYQIDLGNTTKVAPGSLGKIKALYR